MIGPLLLPCAATSTLAQPGPTQVVVVPAELREMKATVSLVGSVEPYTRSLIASEIAGMVEQMDIRAGDRLQQGDVICRLRDVTRKLMVQQAEAELRLAKSQLEELETGTRKEDLERAKAAMEEARALDEKWRHEFERVEALRRQGSASLKEYNDTVAEASAARQRLAQATAAHELAVAGPRQETIAQARFSVEAREAQLAKLKDDLDRTVIRAPYTGYVTARHTEVGEWINVGGPVVELIDLEKVLVKVDVPESAILAARVGEPVGMTIDAIEGLLEGRIKHVNPQADAKARTFPVEIELANPEQTIKSGMFVRARVPSGPAQQALVVPMDAVIQRMGSTLVVAAVPAAMFMGGGGKPAEGEKEAPGGASPPGGAGGSPAAAPEFFGVPMPVQLGAQDGAWVAVSAAGLQPGVPVAVKGHDRVYGPSPVAIVPGPSASQPAGGPSGQAQATTQPG